MKERPTKFSKENQPKAKRRGRCKSERTKILEAMERQGETEEGFYDLLVERAKKPEDNFTFKELLMRLSPLPKAVAPLVEFDFPQDSKPHIQAAYVLAAVSSGIIPSDIGNVFVQSIKSMIDIEAYTALTARIAAIEESLGVSNG